MCGVITQMTYDPLLDRLAEFTWNFGTEYYVEVENGDNYIWSDPDKGGNNTLTKTTESYTDWVFPNWGRSKGKHIIQNVCGTKVIIKQEALINIDQSQK